MIIVNIGGEGEVPGAIDVNDMSGLRRPREAVLRGRLIQGDFMRLPIATGCVDVVVGNRLPLVGSMSRIVMREAYRVLRPGGSIRAFAGTGGGAILLRPMTSAGFVEVTLAGTYAIGAKP